jgi:hypothetical protein
MVDMPLKDMRRAPIVAAVLAAATWAGAANADLAQVQSVYLLPMGSGLDQYIADRLTADHIFHVVTDPKRADAVFTDQIGTAFERRLTELYPPEPLPEPEKSKDKVSEESKKESESGPVGEKLGERTAVPTSTFSRGKGNVFLVDLKSRRVIWSVYERPKRTVPDELHRVSARIVNALKRDLKGPAR